MISRDIIARFHFPADFPTVSGMRLFDRCAWMKPRFVGLYQNFSKRTHFDHLCQSQRVEDWNSYFIAYAIDFKIKSDFTIFYV